MKNLNPQFTHPSKIGYFAYVDEAGNEGFSSSSGNWFLLGAFVVENKNHREAFNTIDTMKTMIRFQDLNDELHFRNLQHEKKKAVIKLLSEMPFTALSVIMSKQWLSNDEKKNLSKFPRLYFFMIKCLLERLSWIARQRDALIEVTFSNRGHVTYDLLEHYIFTVLRHQDVNHSIDFNFLGPIRVVQNKQRKLLQAADAVASGLYNGLEPNVYGDVETAYIQKIKDKFWRRDGKLYDYGIKLLPADKEVEIKKSNELFSLLPD